MVGLQLLVYLHIDYANEMSNEQLSKKRPLLRSSLLTAAPVGTRQRPRKKKKKKKTPKKSGRNGILAE